MQSLGKSPGKDDKKRCFRRVLRAAESNPYYDNALHPSIRVYMDYIARKKDSQGKEGHFINAPREGFLNFVGLDQFAKRDIFKKKKSRKNGKKTEERVLSRLQTESGDYKIIEADGKNLNKSLSLQVMRMVRSSSGSIGKLSRGESPFSKRNELKERSRSIHKISLNKLSTSLSSTKAARSIEINLSKDRYSILRSKKCVNSQKNQRNSIETEEKSNQILGLSNKIKKNGESILNKQLINQFIPIIHKKARRESSIFNKRQPFNEYGLGKNNICKLNKKKNVSPCPKGGGKAKRRKEDYSSMDRDSNSNVKNLSSVSSGRSISKIDAKNEKIVESIQHMKLKLDDIMDYIEDMKLSKDRMMNHIRKIISSSSSKTIGIK